MRNWKFQAKINEDNEVKKKNDMMVKEYGTIT